MCVSNRGVEGDIITQHTIQYLYIFSDNCVLITINTLHSTRNLGCTLNVPDRTIRFAFLCLIGSGSTFYLYYHAANRHSAGDRNLATLSSAPAMVWIFEKAFDDRSYSASRRKTLLTFAAVEAVDWIEWKS